MTKKEEYKLVERMIRDTERELTRQEIKKLDTGNAQPDIHWLRDELRDLHWQRYKIYN
jgi:hypothetical protein